MSLTTNTLPGCMMPDGGPPCVGYAELHDQAAAMQIAFNNAVNFAIDDCDTNTGGIDFLTLWREGCWSEIREDFPEFIEKYGAPE